MKTIIKIEGGYIYLQLDEIQLKSVLDDLEECGDLIKPQIEIVDSCVRFRDQDLKLLQPELFFLRETPKFKFDAPTKNMFTITNLLCFLLFFGILFFLTGSFGLQNHWFIFVGVLILSNACCYQFMYIQQNERQRKALYLKARLLSYFYAVVNHDMTTSNERLERSSQRYARDYGMLKQMFTGLLDEQSDGIKARYDGVHYPDGDAVYELRHNDIKPKKLS